MAGMGKLERLTASDLFLLLWDDFGWSGDIGGLAILDGTSLLDREGRIRIEDIRRQLEPRLNLIPRFRQRLYRPRRGLGWPLWVDATSFDLADHVRVHPLAAPADQAQLLQACQQLARRRLDPARPLWELWLLPGLPERRVGAFFKLHHAFADGMAGVAAFGALLDLTADAPAPDASAWTPTPLPTTGELLRDNLRRPQPGGRSGPDEHHPSGQDAARRATHLAGVAGVPGRAARSTHKSQPSDRTRVPAGHRPQPPGGSQASCPRARRQDQRRGASRGRCGLRQLLASRGEDIQELTLRAMVPISLHHEQSGRASGNQDGWMIVPLPLGEPDAVRRLRLIAAETAERKHMARPRTGTGISGSLLFQRAFLSGFAHQRLMNTSVTNVPGPPVPLYLAGARLLELFPMVSLMGNLTLVVAALSYAGQLNLTAVADRDSCPDVQVFAQGVQGTLDELAKSVPVPSS